MNKHMTKHTPIAAINRRNFLSATAGLTFALTIAPDALSLVDEAFAEAPDPSASLSPSVWLTIAPDGSHPLQKAWIAEQVPQCGYCQSGQIMQAASLLAKNSNPTKEEVVAHMDGNLCRCMTYSRIQKAIMRAATEMRTASNAGNERRAT